MLNVSQLSRTDILKAAADFSAVSFAEQERTPFGLATAHIFSRVFKVKHGISRMSFVRSGC